MANNTYTLEVEVTEGNTVVLADDGSGQDWLVISSIHTDNFINLDYTYDGSNTPTSAIAYYYVGSNRTQLIVNGAIENARGANGADYVAGNSLANILYGDSAATGAGGNDTLDGAEGNDTIYGGAGNDTINGGEGNDRLLGGDGNDTLQGVLGTDTLEGGAGADVLSGGSDPYDRLSYAGSNAGVQVSLTYGVTTTGAGGHAQGDQISGFRSITGSRFADVLIDTDVGTLAFGYNESEFDGGAGNDLLNTGGGNDTGLGGAGNDTIYGGEGNDALAGGLHHDHLYGEAGNDYIIGEGGNDRGYGGAGNDWVSGDDGNDTLDGGAQHDRIAGGAGNDQLLGGTGNDTLQGDAGADRLTGGTGADRFVFRTAADSTSAPTGRDTILDFSHAQLDRIDLSAIDANGAGAGNGTFTFRGSAGFTGAGAELRVTANGTGWLVSADIDGDRVADFAILVSGPGVPALVASDFLL